MFKFFTYMYTHVIIRSFICSTGSMTDVKLFVFFALLPNCLPCCRGWTEKGEWRQPELGSMYKSSVKAYKAGESISDNFNRIDNV